MIRDKQSVRVEARAYANEVKTAGMHFREAEEKIKEAKQKIGADWKGEAGTAMVQVLDNLQKEVALLASQAETAASSIISQGEAVYDGWVDEPDEAEPQGGGGSFGGGGSMGGR